MFLDHLREFAKRFITQHKIVVDKYHFCRQDTVNDIFMKYRLDDEINPEMDYHHHESPVLEGHLNQKPIPSFREYLQNQALKRPALNYSFNRMQSINTLTKIGTSKDTRLSMSRQDPYNCESIQFLKELIPIHGK